MEALKIVPKVLLFGIVIPGVASIILNLIIRRKLALLKYH